MSESRCSGVCREPLFATSCCNTFIATWSTPSEPPHKKFFLEVYSCCGFWLWFWLATVVNLFVLSLVCFICRTALTFPSPPNISSDLFIGLMRMRVNRSYTGVFVAQCWWLLLTPDGKVGASGRGIFPFALAYLKRAGWRTCTERKKYLAPFRARGSTWPFLAGVPTQRFSTQALEL